MVGLWVSPAEAEREGGGEVRRGEAVTALPGSAEGPVSGPGLAGLRSSAVGSAGTGERTDLKVRPVWVVAVWAGRIGRGRAGRGSL